MFTKDYVDWLVKSFNFQFTVIQKVHFYNKCENLNSIVKDMTFELKKKWKNVINFAAGYFGLIENGKPTAKQKLIASISKY